VNNKIRVKLKLSNSYFGKVYESFPEKGKEKLERIERVV